MTQKEKQFEGDKPDCPTVPENSPQGQDESLAKDEQETATGVRHRRIIFIVFAAVAIVWLIIDRISKSIVDEYDTGDVIAGPFAGIFEFRLVHNTGGAWGIFGGSTMILAVISIIVCIVILAIVIYAARRLTFLETIGLSLVFAGGLGNAIDRIYLQYVVDFIRPVFIDFPTFNVADIGVTCGFVLLILGLIISYVREARHG
ncbi:MAG: signal peptidase II [Eggerthellaceae bacterium]|nr:signal peptidase II [Eggerthellaceae bacterium]